MKRIVVLTLLVLVWISSQANEYADRNIFELRIYHLSSPSQEQRMDKYLKEAFIPAMHRAGVQKIGVFKTFDSTAGKLIYVFIPYKSLKQWENIPAMLEKDQKHTTDGRDYIDALYSDPPYVRMETIILKAFSGMPSYSVPKFNTPASERVYELRSYEGHTEKIWRNKVKMFNDGNEIGLFKRLGFNAVFYGEVMAGSKMPNLMYMTTFENKASRDEHWKTFGADPEWKKTSSLPEYQHNVSKNVMIFLRPTEYSEI